MESDLDIEVKQCEEARKIYFDENWSKFVTFNDVAFMLVGSVLNTYGEVAKGLEHDYKGSAYELACALNLDMKELRYQVECHDELEDSFWENNPAFDREKLEDYL